MKDRTELTDSTIRSINKLRNPRRRENREPYEDTDGTPKGCSVETTSRPR